MGTRSRSNSANRSTGESKPVAVESGESSATQAQTEKIATGEDTPASSDHQQEDTVEKTEEIVAVPMDKATVETQEEECPGVTQDTSSELVKQSDGGHPHKSQDREDRTQTDTVEKTEDQQGDDQATEGPGGETQTQHSMDESRVGTTVSGTRSDSDPRVTTDPLVENSENAEPESETQPMETEETEEVPATPSNEIQLMEEEEDTVEVNTENMQVDSGSDDQKGDKADTTESEETVDEPTKEAEVMNHTSNKPSVEMMDDKTTVAPNTEQTSEATTPIKKTRAPKNASEIASINTSNASANDQVFENYVSHVVKNPKGQGNSKDPKASVVTTEDLVDYITEERKRSDSSSEEEPEIDDATHKRLLECPSTMTALSSRPASVISNSHSRAGSTRTPSTVDGQEEDMDSWAVGAMDLDEPIQSKATESRQPSAESNKSRSRSSSSNRTDLYTSEDTGSGDRKTQSPHPMGINKTEVASPKVLKPTASVPPVKADNGITEIPEGQLPPWAALPPKASSRSSSRERTRSTKGEALDAEIAQKRSRTPVPSETTLDMSVVEEMIIESEDTARDDLIALTMGQKTMSIAAQSQLVAGHRMSDVGPEIIKANTITQIEDVTRRESISSAVSDATPPSPIQIRVLNGKTPRMPAVTGGAITDKALATREKLEWPKTMKIRRGTENKRSTMTYIDSEGKVVETDAPYILESAKYRIKTVNTRYSKEVKTVSDLKEDQELNHERNRIMGEIELEYAHVMDWVGQHSKWMRHLTLTGQDAIINSYLEGDGLATEALIIKDNLTKVWPSFEDAGKVIKQTWIHPKLYLPDGVENLLTMAENGIRGKIDIKENRAALRGLTTAFHVEAKARFKEFQNEEALHRAADAELSPSLSYARARDRLISFFHAEGWRAMDILNHWSEGREMVDVEHHVQHCDVPKIMALVKKGGKKHHIPIPRKTALEHCSIRDVYPTSRKEDLSIIEEDDVRRVKKVSTPPWFPRRPMKSFYRFYEDERERQVKDEAGKLTRSEELERQYRGYTQPVRGRQKKSIADWAYFELLERYATQEPQMVMVQLDDPATIGTDGGEEVAEFNEEELNEEPPNDMDEEFNDENGADELHEMQDHERANEAKGDDVHMDTGDEGDLEAERERNGGLTEAELRQGHQLQRQRDEQQYREEWHETRSRSSQGSQASSKSPKTSHRGDTSSQRSTKRGDAAKGGNNGNNERDTEYSEGTDDDRDEARRKATYARSMRSNQTSNSAYGNVSSMSDINSSASEESHTRSELEYAAHQQRLADQTQQGRGHQAPREASDHGGSQQGSHQGSQHGGSQNTAARRSTTQNPWSNGPPPAAMATRVGGPMANRAPVVPAAAQQVNGNMTVQRGSATQYNNYAVAAATPPHNAQAEEPPSEAIIRQMTEQMKQMETMLAQQQQLLDQHRQQQATTAATQGHRQQPERGTFNEQAPRSNRSHRDTPARAPGVGPQPVHHPPYINRVFNTGLPPGQPGYQFYNQGPADNTEYFNNVTPVDLPSVAEQQQILRRQQYQENLRREAQRMREPLVINNDNDIRTQTREAGPPGYSPDNTETGRKFSDPQPIMSEEGFRRAETHNNWAATGGITRAIREAIDRGEISTVNEQTGERHISANWSEAYPRLQQSTGWVYETQPKAGEPTTRHEISHLAAAGQWEIIREGTDGRLRDGMGYEVEPWELDGRNSQYHPASSTHPEFWKRWYWCRRYTKKKAFYVDCEARWKRFEDRDDKDKDGPDEEKKFGLPLRPRDWAAQHPAGQTNRPEHGHKGETGGGGKQSGGSKRSHASGSELYATTHPLGGVQNLEQRRADGYTEQSDTRVAMGSTKPRGTSLHLPGAADPKMPPSNTWNTRHVMYFNHVMNRCMFGDGTYVPEQLFWELTSVCNPDFAGERYVFDASRITPDKEWVRGIFAPGVVHLQGIDSTGAERELIYHVHVEWITFGRLRDHHDISKATEETWDPHPQSLAWLSEEDESRRYAFDARVTKIPRSGNGVKTYTEYQTLRDEYLADTTSEASHRRLREYIKRDEWSDTDASDDESDDEGWTAELEQALRAEDEQRWRQKIQSARDDKNRLKREMAEASKRRPLDKHATNEAYQRWQSQLPHTVIVKTDRGGDVTIPYKRPEATIKVEAPATKRTPTRDSTYTDWSRPGNQHCDVQMANKVVRRRVDADTRHSRENSRSASPVRFSDETPVRRGNDSNYDSSAPSLVNDESDDEVEILVNETYNGTPAEISKRRLMFESLKARIPTLKTWNVSEVQTELNAIALPLMNLEATRGRTMELTPAMRLAVRYIYEYAPDDTVVPTPEMRLQQDRLLSLGVHIRYKEPESMDPEGASVYFNKVWEILDNGKAIPTPLKGRRKSKNPAPNPLRTSPIGRMLYMGHKVSEDYANQMPHALRRYVMSVLNGRVFIDASRPYTDGPFQGRLTITACINSNRHSISKNNVKLVAPVTDDIGEMVFLDQQPDMEVVMYYGSSYDWDFEKLKLMPIIGDMYMRVVRDVKSWHTQPRVDKIKDLLAGISRLTVTGLKQLRRMQLTRFSRRDPTPLLMRTIISVMDGTIQTDDFHDYTLQAMNEEVNINDMHFPEHLNHMREFRQAVSFKNWKHPDRPPFRLEPFIQALEDMFRTKIWAPELTESQKNMLAVTPLGNYDKEGDKTESPTTMVVINQTGNVWKNEWTREVDYTLNLSGGEELALERLASMNATSTLTVSEIATIRKAIKRLKQMHTTMVSMEVDPRRIQHHRDLMNRIEAKFAVMKEHSKVVQVDTQETASVAESKISASESRTSRDNTEPSRREKRQLRDERVAQRERRDRSTLQQHLEDERMEMRYQQAQEKRRAARGALIPVFNDQVAKAQIRRGRWDNQDRSVYQSMQDWYDSPDSESERTKSSSDSISESEDSITRGYRRPDRQRSNSASRDRHGDSASQRTRSRSRTGGNGTHYPWERRKIPDGKERQFLSKINLPNGIFNHVWDNERRIGRRGPKLSEKLDPIPNINLADSQRKKHMEFSCNQDQLGCPVFDGSGSIEFMDQVLSKMREFNMHPLAVLNAFQTAKWFTQGVRTKLRDMARLDPDTAAYNKIEWTDEDCIEKAIIALDDFIPRLLDEYRVTSKTAETSDVSTLIAEARLRIPNMLGIHPLFLELRTYQLRLPKEERCSFRAMNTDFENAIKRTICADPNQLFADYVHAKMIAQLQLGISIDAEMDDAKKFKLFAEITEEITDLADRQGLSDGSHGNGLNNRPGNTQRRERETRKERNERFERERALRAKDTHRETRPLNGRGTAMDPIRIRSITESALTNQERTFRRYFDTDTHQPAGLCERILVNVIQETGMGKYAPETQNRVRDQISPEQRVHCTCCGFTGHEITTCNVVNAEGTIDKNLLALATKQRADTRMQAAWEKGGSLTGYTEAQFLAFRAEVDRLRDQNPQGNNRPPYDRGGRGGRGEFNGSSGRGYGRGYERRDDRRGGAPNYSSVAPSYPTRQSYNGGGRGDFNRSQGGDRSGIYGPGDPSDGRRNNYAANNGQTLYPVNAQRQADRPDIFRQGGRGAGRGDARNEGTQSQGAPNGGQATASPPQVTFQTPGNPTVIPVNMLHQASDEEIKAARMSSSRSTTPDKESTDGTETPRTRTPHPWKEFGLDSSDDEPAQPQKKRCEEFPVSNAVEEIENSDTDVHVRISSKPSYRTLVDKNGNPMPTISDGTLALLKDMDKTLHDADDRLFVSPDSSQASAQATTLVDKYPQTQQYDTQYTDSYQTQPREGEYDETQSSTQSSSGQDLNVETPPKEDFKSISPERTVAGEHCASPVAMKGVLMDMSTCNKCVEEGDKSYHVGDRKIGEEVPTSNKGLVYFNFSILPPEAFATKQGFKLYNRSNPTIVQGFDGSMCHVKHYIIVVICVEGINIRGETVVRRFETQAMVAPVLSADFLLGSNVAVDHNIVIIPDAHSATMFRGEELLIVKCMAWNDVQKSLLMARQNKIKANLMSCKVMTEQNNNTVTDTDKAMEKKAHDLAEIQLYHEELRKRVIAYVNADSHIQVLHAQASITNKLLEDPMMFTKAGRHLSRDRYYVATLIIAAQYFHIERVTEQYQMLDKIFLNHDRDMIGQSQVFEELAKPEIKRAIDLVRLHTEVFLHKHPLANMVALTINTFREVSEEFDHAIQKVDEEYETSRRQVELIRRNMATDCLHEFRPEEFDKELWPYVMNTEKPKVMARFRAFDHDRPHLMDTLTKIRAIDVSMESPARKLEAPLFRAQLMANITRFAHPDKDDQPTVKGREFVIEVRDDDKEPIAARYQRFDPWQTRFLHVKIRHMIAEKRMERSTSPWNSRLALVPYTDRIQKFVLKHGNNVLAALHDEANSAEVMTFFRLTTDLRNVNNKTKAMIYPLPNISDIISQCEGCDRYTTGDLCDAFFTVRMELASREYTAFSTPGGRFQYTVMPQGARNAATFWAEMIADIFKPMLSKNRPVIVYQDDVGNRAKDLISHLDTQQEIYDILGEHSMIFKTTKMHCNYKTQRILGHVLNGEGRVPDPKTLEAVTDLQIPRTLKEVRSVLGLFQYAREYIENMSSIMEPIQALTKKGIDIQETWDPRIHGAAFEALKIALTSAPILKIPDISKPFTIQVDSCRVGRGIGAILLQEDEEGVLRPCQYWSRALSTAERRYSATDLEATGLHDAILHWKVFLQNGHRFTAIVDHYALVYMVTKMSANEQQNQRLLRLCLDLQGYHFNVVHQAGVKHIGADAVSRLLRNGEEHYVRNEDDLRDDWGPLTEEEKSRLVTEYSQDAWLIIDTINEKREQDRLARIEYETEIAEQQTQQLLTGEVGQVSNLPFMHQNSNMDITMTGEFENDAVARAEETNFIMANSLSEQHYGQMRRFQPSKRAAVGLCRQHTAESEDNYEDYAEQGRMWPQSNDEFMEQITVERLSCRECRDIMRQQVLLLNAMDAKPETSPAALALEVAIHMNNEELRRQQSDHEYGLAVQHVQVSDILAAQQRSLQARERMINRVAEQCSGRKSYKKRFTPNVYETEQFRLMKPKIQPREDEYDSDGQRMQCNMMREMDNEDLNKTISMCLDSENSSVEDIRMDESEPNTSQESQNSAYEELMRKPQSGSGRTAYIRSAGQPVQRAAEHLNTGIPSLTEWEEMHKSNPIILPYDNAQSYDSYKVNGPPQSKIIDGPDMTGVPQIIYDAAPVEAINTRQIEINAVRRAATLTNTSEIQRVDLPKDLFATEGTPEFTSLAPIIPSRPLGQPFARWKTAIKSPYDTEHIQYTVTLDTDGYATHRPINWPTGARTEEMNKWLYESFMTGSRAMKDSVKHDKFRTKLLMAAREFDEQRELWATSRKPNAQATLKSHQRDKRTEDRFERQRAAEVRSQQVEQLKKRAEEETRSAEKQHSIRVERIADQFCGQTKSPSGKNTWPENPTDAEIEEAHEVVKKRRISDSPMRSASASPIAERIRQISAERKERYMESRRNMGRNTDTQSENHTVDRPIFTTAIHNKNGTFTSLIQREIFEDPMEHQGPPRSPLRDAHRRQAPQYDSDDNEQIEEVTYTQKGTAIQTADDRHDKYSKAYADVCGQQRMYTCYRDFCEKLAAKMGLIEAYYEEDMTPKERRGQYGEAFLSFWADMYIIKNDNPDIEFSFETLELIAWKLMLEKNGEDDESVDNFSEEDKMRDYCTRVSMFDGKSTAELQIRSPSLALSTLNWAYEAYLLDQVEHMQHVPEEMKNKARKGKFAAALERAQQDEATRLEAEGCKFSHIVSDDIEQSWTKLCKVDLTRLNDEAFGRLYSKIHNKQVPSPELISKAFAPKRFIPHDPTGQRVAVYHTQSQQADYAAIRRDINITRIMEEQRIENEMKAKKTSKKDSRMRKYFMDSDEDSDAEPKYDTDDSSDDSDGDGNNRAPPKQAAKIEPRLSRRDARYQGTEGRTKTVTSTHDETTQYNQANWLEPEEKATLEYNDDTQIINARWKPSQKYGMVNIITPATEPRQEAANMRNGDTPERRTDDTENDLTHRLSRMENEQKSPYFNEKTVISVGGLTIVRDKFNIWRDKFMLPVNELGQVINIEGGDPASHTWTNSPEARQHLKELRTERCGTDEIFYINSKTGEARPVITRAELGLMASNEDTKPGTRATKNTDLDQINTGNRLYTATQRLGMKECLPEHQPHLFGTGGDVSPTTGNMSLDQKRNRLKSMSLTTMEPILQTQAEHMRHINTAYDSSIVEQRIEAMKKWNEEMSKRPVIYTGRKLTMSDLKQRSVPLMQEYVRPPKETWGIDVSDCFHYIKVTSGQTGGEKKKPKAGIQTQTVITQRGYNMKDAEATNYVPGTMEKTAHRVYTKTAETANTSGKVTSKIMAYNHVTSAAKGRVNKTTLEKTLVSTATSTLQAALLQEEIQTELRSAIREELKKRQEQKTNPVIKCTSTPLLLAKLDRLHDELVSHGWDTIDTNEVDRIELELVHRGQRSADQHRRNAHIAELQQLYIQRAQKECHIDHAKRHTHLMEQGRVDETSENALAFDRYIRKIYGPNTVSLTDDRFNQLLLELGSKPPPLREPMENRMIDIINERYRKTGDRLEQMAETARHLEHINRVKHLNQEDHIKVNVMTHAEKVALRGHMAPKMSQAEKDIRERMSLVARRNAQTQATKLQERKTELAKKAQQLTTQRINKMNSLRTELRKLTKRHTTDEEFAEEERNRLIDIRLEDEGDCLISQHFIEPETEQMYEIVDVIMKKRPSKAKTSPPGTTGAEEQYDSLAVARPIHSTDDGSWRTELRQFKLDEVTEWVNNYARGKRDYEDTAVPSNEHEWLTAQMADDYCRRVLEKLTTRWATFPLDGLKSEESTEYLFRNQLSDGTLGPLYRRSYKNREIHATHMSVTIKQELVQKLVPRALVDKIIWIVHDQMGHPGRTRTIETMRLNERPNSRVHMDTAGPFPLARSGGYYIIVLKDALTNGETAGRAVEREESSDHLKKSKV
eukprot:gene21960-28041_t